MKMSARSRQTDLRQMDLIEWMSSAAGFPARTSALLGKAQDLPANDPASGSNTLGSVSA